MITDSNYCQFLDRLDFLWNLPTLTKEEKQELDGLVDLLSGFEEQRYPIMNNPTYRDLYNERFKLLPL